MSSLSEIKMTGVYKHAKNNKEQVYKVLCERKKQNNEKKK